MIKDNKRYFIATIIMTALAVVINAFIIMQSCLDAVQSTESSSFAVNLFKNIINAFKADTNNESNIGTFTSVIRKLIGHFGLFLVSGVISSWALHLWIKPLTWYKNYRFIYGSLTFGLFLAALTEFIQTYTPGRSGEITDVLIDFGGYLLGFSIIFLILFLLQRNKEKGEEV